jgi:hypothetical protein
MQKGRIDNPAFFVSSSLRAKRSNPRRRHEERMDWLRRKVLLAMTETVALHSWPLHPVYEPRHQIATAE